MRFLALGLVLAGCGVVDRSPPEPRHASPAALTVSNVELVSTPASAIGRALASQRNPAVASKSPTEQLVVWEDRRNARLRDTDLYGARLINGAPADLGARLISGPRPETEPSVAHALARYWLAYTGRKNFGTDVEVVSVSDDLAVTPRFQAAGAYARVAAGTDGVLLVYRAGGNNEARAVLLQSAGAPSPSVSPRPSDNYLGPLAVRWSDAHSAWFVLTPSYAGLALTRVARNPDGGAPLADAPVLVQAVPFSNAMPPLSAADLDVGPAGELGLAWRIASSAWVLALPAPPTSPLDAGQLISNAVTAAPSISWNGSAFRVATSTASAAEVWLADPDGGLTLESNAAPVASPSACPSCPPTVLFGTSSVVTLPPPVSDPGFDFDLGLPDGSVVTRSGNTAGEGPAAAWSATGGLLVWTEPAFDGGQHEFLVQRFTASGARSGILRVGGGEASLPTAHSENGRWYFGGLRGGNAVVYATDSVNSATQVYARGSNASPSFARGWVAISNVDAVEFSHFATDGGLAPPDAGAYTSAWLPSLAVDSSDRPLAVTVTRVGLGPGEKARTNVPWSNAFEELTGAAGRGGENHRFAVIASDGVGFLTAYTELAGTNLALVARPLSLRSDGGITLGAPRTITVAGQVDAPSLVWANGQYLLAWSDRDDVSAAGKLRLWHLPADGGAGLDLGLSLPRADDTSPRLAVAPNGTDVMLTWVTLNAPDSGMPAAMMARLQVGAAPGATCVTGAQCATGSCARGVCCDSACDDGCGECSSGRCTPLAFGTACDAGECKVVSGVCTGTSLSCPAISDAPDDSPCALDAGRCMSGVCMLVDAGTALDAGAPDGGDDAGTTDAGTTDAGTTDAGTTDSGTTDAGAGDAGDGNDAGPTDAGAVDAGTGNVSHYSWSQGCGCASLEGPLGLFALALLRRARARRTTQLVPTADLPLLRRAAWRTTHVAPTDLPLLRRASARRTTRVAPTDLPLLPRASARRTTRVAPTDALRRALARRLTQLALLALVAVALLAARPAGAQPKRLKLSFPGVSAGAGAKTEDAQALSEFVQSQLVARDVYAVTGASDITALLGAERQRELLGCGDAATTCFAELAGALDADRLLTGSLSRLGDTWVLTLALTDPRTATPLFRSSRRFTGGLDRALDAVDPLLDDLLERDGKALASAGKPPPAPPPTSKHQWTVGLRAEGDVLGLAQGQPAIAPALTATWGYSLFGAALTFIPMVTPGVRAEARLHLFEQAPVRPLVAVGATLFGAAFAPRAALGATADLGPLRLGLDLALEYFVSGPARFAPLSLLVALGAAVRF